MDYPVDPILLTELSQISSEIDGYLKEHLSVSESHLKYSTSLIRQQLLELDSSDIGSSDQPLSDECTQVKISERTVEDIAKILANPFVKESPKISPECQGNDIIIDKVIVDETDVPNQVNLSDVATSNIENSNINIEVNSKLNIKKDVKEKIKKKKKVSDYVPKLVPINWSDPRKDLKFMKELEEIMRCDAFDFKPSDFSVPLELDDMAENISLASMPRNIVEMCSATDEELADWEYSINIEKNEATDEEDSENEEIENELKAIKSFKKCSQPNEVLLEKTKSNVDNAAINISEFLQVLMPPSAEEIMGKRDDEGNISTYESVPRSEEEISREIERLHLELDSDSEEDDAEDKPEDKMYEIDWEKDKIKIKENKLLGLENLSESELKNRLQEIEDYFANNTKSGSAEINPIFDEHAKKVDAILSKLGFPKQREIKENTIDEYLMEDLNKYDVIFKEHQGKICPPGNLISVVQPGDPDYHFVIEEQSSLSPEKQTIKKPLNFGLNIYDSAAESEDDLALNESIPTSKIEKLPETIELCKASEDKKKLFPQKEDSYLWTETLKIDDFLSYKASKKVAKTKCRIKKKIIEPEEQELDHEFKKEYFKRGGTIEGLGECCAATEPNLKLESLESYSEKFLTYPYANEGSESLNFVRMRRNLAMCFPEFSNEVFSDLSKVDNFPLPDFDNSSDSDSSEDILTTFKSDPYTTEELLTKHTETIKEASTASKNENSSTSNKPIRSSKNNEGDSLTNIIQKGAEVEGKSQSDEKSSLFDTEITEDSDIKKETMTVQWNPLKYKPTPSSENTHKNMQIINEILVPTNTKFKVPNRLKEWIKGMYEPSRDEIKIWKQLFIDYYGDINFLLSHVMSSEDHQNEYDLLMAESNPPEKANLISIFKKLLPDQIIKDDDENDVSFDDVGAEYFSSKSSEVPLSENFNIEMNEEDSFNYVQREKTSKEKVKNDTLEIDSKDNDDVAEKIAESSAAPKIPVLRLIDVPRPLRKEEWAEEINSNAKIELDGNPAISYPFELDGFQKHAIKALEDGYNVFVSAHTSAGKTVVAEYAIAMSKRNRSKAVYTSPVKALSNQKYADFKRIFGSVGLITGDIQLNENAECLIMTTEILRSMLYNTSEKIRDLEFVVFDEVHYINDPERGHVWEEVLILLPPQVQIVMLSATVPNTLEFANWVGRTKLRKVIVCATMNRPVPLQHYVYTGTGGPSPGETYLVKDGNGPFLFLNYEKAEIAMKNAQEKERKNRKKQQMKRAEEDKEWKKGGYNKPKPFSHASDSQDKRDQTLWISVVDFLQKKDWLPAVVFVFSRKKCDTFADRLKNIDLTTKAEKSSIHKFITRQVGKLDEVDQDLPQIQVMQNQLKQGIGVHHSGILPIMKEIVEVLFQEGKVKLLFATETFAMGVNMPARTVLFHSIKKFDGNEIRLLHPAEYIQMAGRAGRRGKDLAGNVIILAKPTELIARHDLETLMFGNPSKLISKFRLSYRMILNTLTMSGMLTVQSMMASSYCENQGQLKKKFVEKDLIEAEQIEKTHKKKVNNDIIDLSIEHMSKFYTYAHEYINKWKDLRLKMITSNTKLWKEFQPGKLLKICSGHHINRTALLLTVEQNKDPSIRYIFKVMILDQDIQHTRDITLNGVEMNKEQLEEWYRLVSLMDNLPLEKDILSGPNDYSQLSLKAHEIISVFKNAVKYNKNDLTEYLNDTSNNRTNFRRISHAGDKLASQLWSNVEKNIEEFPEAKPGFENYNLCLDLNKMDLLAKEMKKFPVNYNPLVLNSFRKVVRWKQAEQKVKNLKLSLSDENMILYPDFKNKKALLKEKGYIDDSDTVQIKGYMAARVGKYELVVCELLVENILVDLEPEEVAALLSFLVCRSNNSDHYPTSFKTLTASLQKGIQQCQKIIKDVILLEKQFQIEDFEGSETSKLSFGLVPIMYAWVKQEPFKRIMEMEELKEFEFQEGLLVRWIQQLLEMLKEVEAAARVMGDPGVPSKLQAAGQLIKRGIVFAPSLYTTMQ